MAEPTPQQARADILAAPAAPNGQNQGEPRLAPSQIVALARGSEALAAAHREATFERALRGRVEAQVGLLRSAMARLRAKLRMITEQLGETRTKAIPPVSPACHPVRRFPLRE